MHDKNIFKDGLDFKYLCGKYPTLCPYVNVNVENGRYFFAFSNVKALRELCRVTLLEYFQMDVIIADNKLVPRIPMRLNYVLWVQDLLDMHRINLKNQNSTVYWGMDVGCGPYNLFSAMLSKAHPDWKFIGTDIDEENIRLAQQNLIKNNLDSRIQVLQENDEGFGVFFDSMDNIITGCGSLSPRLTTMIFTMCNPPFFDNQIERPSIKASTSVPLFFRNSILRNSRSKMRQNTYSDPHEISFYGGEEEFMRCFIFKSLKYLNKEAGKDNIKLIFTSMLGKKSTMKKLKTYISSLGSHLQVETTTFTQGKTKRWGISWFLKLNI